MAMGEFFRTNYLWSISDIKEKQERTLEFVEGGMSFTLMIAYMCTVIYRRARFQKMFDTFDLSGGDETSLSKTKVH
jgi:hypothetical protein